MSIIIIIFLKKLDLVDLPGGFELDGIGGPR